MTALNWSDSFTMVAPSSGSRDGLGFFSPWLTRTLWSKPLPSGLSCLEVPSGRCAGATRLAVLTQSKTLLARAALGGFPPLVRVQIEQLACCSPAGIGLHMTHWSTRTLAKAAVDQGLVPGIAHSTVSLLLRDADLQPHRSRYWKTPTLDDTFRQRAARVLWCYENAEKLAARGELVVCLDEKANLQALARRRPPRPMRPGHIEQQEHEYVRHGTVTFLAALAVPLGTMWGRSLGANDSAHLRPALHTLFRVYARQWRRVHVIWDGGSSHVASETEAFLRSYGPSVRVLLTPAHASWLNQAELLLRAFSARYLVRGDWPGRVHLVEHLDASWREYNRLYAHPFTWSWTRQHLRDWLSRHGA